MAIQKVGATQFQDLFDVVGAGAFSINPAAYVDNESQVLQVTVAGAALGDFVFVAPGNDIAEVTFSAFVSAANTVTVRASNITASAVDPASASYSVLVFGAS